VAIALVGKVTVGLVESNGSLPLSYLQADCQETGITFVHQKHKRQTEITNITNYALVWYAFYYLQSGNGVGPILTAPEPTFGAVWSCGAMVK